MWVTILLISEVKKRIFAQNDQIWPKIGIFGQFGPGHAGLFSALLVGRLVVVARGLYLARHLFTLYKLIDSNGWKNMCFVSKSVVKCYDEKCIIEVNRSVYPGSF